MFSIDFLTVKDGRQIKRKIEKDLMGYAEGYELHLRGHKAAVKIIIVIYCNK